MSQQQRIGTVATTVYTNEHGQTVVKYHSTTVVAFDSVTIKLETGGWCSATTKTRMNQASNQFGLGYYVYQKDFTWFVRYKGRTIEWASNRDALMLDRRWPNVSVQ